MKKSNQNTYNDTEQNSGISRFQREIIIYAETEGMHAGKRNKPVIVDEMTGSIIKNIQAKVQHERERNHQDQLPVHVRLVAQKFQTETKAKIQHLQPKLNDQEHQLKQLQSERREVKPNWKKRLIRTCVHVVVAFMAITEGYFIHEALRYAGFPRPAALVTACVVGLGVGFGAHFIAAYICNSQTKQQRKYRAILTVLPTGIFFYLIGSMRAGAYNNIINLSLAPKDIFLPITSIISAWNLTAFSYIIYIYSVVFSMWVLKTKEEREREKRYEEISEEIKQCEKVMQSLEAEINQAAKEARDKEAEALQHFEHAVATEKRLQAIAQMALCAYIDKNLRYRTDGFYPPFFSDPPPFQFTTLLNNNQNNKQ